jgi:hypothetical protein
MQDRTTTSVDLARRLGRRERSSRGSTQVRTHVDLLPQPPAGPGVSRGCGITPSAARPADSPRVSPRFPGPSLRLVGISRRLRPATRPAPASRSSHRLPGASRAHIGRIVMDLLRHPGLPDPQDGSRSSSKGRLADVRQVWVQGAGGGTVGGTPPAKTRRYRAGQTVGRAGSGRAATRGAPVPRKVADPRRWVVSSATAPP